MKIPDHRACVQPFLCYTVHTCQDNTRTCNICHHNGSWHSNSLSCQFHCHCYCKIFKLHAFIWWFLQYRVNKTKMLVEVFDSTTVLFEITRLDLNPKSQNLETVKYNDFAILQLGVLYLIAQRFTKSDCSLVTTVTLRKHFIDSLEKVINIITIGLILPLALTFWCLLLLLWFTHANRRFVLYSSNQQITYNVMNILLSWQ